MQVCTNALLCLCAWLRVLATPGNTSRPQVTVEYIKAATMKTNTDSAASKRHFETRGV